MIIKDCGTAFTQIREHLGKTKGELAEELELGKHGERLIERIEQNKEDVQPATLRKLLDLWFGDNSREIWHQFLEQMQEDCAVEDFEVKHKTRVKILYTILTASVALTIVNTVVFFT